MADILTLRRKSGELNTQRVDLVEKMDAILASAGETMTDEQKGDFDTLDAEVQVLDVEIKANDAEIERFERIEKYKASQAKPFVPAYEPDRIVPAEAKAPKEKGTDFARISKALIAAKGNALVAAQWAETQAWDNKADIAKALGSSTAVGGGYLVPVEYSSDIIDLLRNQTVVYKAGPQIMPMNGTLEVPKLASGANGGYVGENATRNAEEPTFGNVKLTTKKLMAKVPVSNDLIRNSSPQADMVVRDDIVAGLSVTADAALLRDLGDGAAPKGLRYWAAAGNQLNTAGTTSANIESDLSDMLGGLQDYNVPMIRCVWFMAPRSFRHLYNLRDANGNLIYPELRGPTPMLYSYPVMTTNQIPTNLGGGTATEIYLVDMAQVIIGEEGGIELKISDEASYSNSSGTQTSAFDNDQTVIRAIMRHDMVVRYDRAIAVTTDVTWGA